MVRSPLASTTSPANTLPKKVCYSLGIYLLNLFLAFLQPKFDPSLEQVELEEGGPSALPTTNDEEFRPFIRRLPEFKFWHSATRAITIGFFCTWFQMFDIPVFWPVLVVYWFLLFTLTSEYTLFEMISAILGADLIMQCGDKSNI